MIFYRFLLNTQPLGYLFVLEMLFAAHAINLLALCKKSLAGIWNIKLMEIY